LKEYGEIPGGKNELKHLLYPFYRFYPFKILSKFRWWRNSKLKDLLPALNKNHNQITVIDRLGAPGDALITANVIRCIKDNYPNLKINCITPHPELLKLDPHIDSINQKETFYSFDSTYWELIVRKEKKTNIIRHNLDRLGIKEYEYKARYYISKEEKEWAKDKINRLNKPLIGICTKSKETVKNWPESNWKSLVETLTTIGQVIHLGDNSEPKINGITRFAGKTKIRDSAALLSCCDFFIGPDSLLMHIANGLDIPSIIIFGGSRPVDCFGYEENINLFSQPHCSPCWIHDGYQQCNENFICLSNITKNQIISHLKRYI
jgi:ADP-heptose:LPS heptosyltransferase